MVEAMRQRKTHLFDLRIDSIDRAEPSPVHPLDVLQLTLVRAGFFICWVGVGWDDDDSESEHKRRRRRGMSFKKKGE
jgi:hypothetical protein